MTATSKKGGKIMSVSHTLSRAFAVGILCAAGLVAGAGAASADDTIACEPGQIVIDGQCNVPPNPASHPDGTAGSGTSGQSGDSGHH